MFQNIGFAQRRHLDVLHSGLRKLLLTSKLLLSMLLNPLQFSDVVLTENRFYKPTSHYTDNYIDNMQSV